MSNNWTPPPGWSPGQPPMQPPAAPPGYPPQGGTGMPPPFMPPQPAGQGGKFVLQVLGLGCFGLVVIGVTGLLLLIFIAELGLPGFVLASLMAFVPAVFYLIVVRLVDRYDPEPLWALALAFIWGGVISIFGALLVNDTASAVASAASGGSADVADFVGAVISAPIAEEGFKGLGLLVVLLALRKHFDGVVDGIVYACVIALGFATVENVLYYGRAVVEAGIGGGVVLMILRGMMAPFSHPLFTSMTGIGFGIARERKRGVLVWTAPIIGYCAAVFLHAMWNLIATLASSAGGAVFFGAYAVIWIPSFLIFMCAVGYCLNRERKIIRTHLVDEVALGVISQDEYTAITSLFRRNLFHWKGFQSNGFSGYMAAKNMSGSVVKLALSKYHTLRASEVNTQTRSLGAVPVLRQEIARYRSEMTG